MFRTQVFAKALQIRKGITYDLGQSELPLMQQIVYPAWIELVDKYTTKQYPSYNIEHMLREYAKGNIEVTWSYTPISAVYEDVKFVNSQHLPLESRAEWRVRIDRSLWHKAFLKDELVSYDLLLQNGDKAYRIGNGNPKRAIDVYYSCLTFLKFAVDQLGFTELYRLHPKPLGWENSFMFTCINEGGATLKAKEHSCIIEDLGDIIFKYRYPKSIVDELSQSDLRRLYYGD